MEETRSSLIVEAHLDMRDKGEVGGIKWAIKIEIIEYEIMWVHILQLTWRGLFNRIQLVGNQGNIMIVWVLKLAIHNSCRFSRSIAPDLIARHFLFTPNPQILTSFLPHHARSLDFAHSTAGREFLQDVALWNIPHYLLLLCPHSLSCRRWTRGALGSHTRGLLGDDHCCICILRLLYFRRGYQTGAQLSSIHCTTHRSSRDFFQNR